MKNYMRVRGNKQRLQRLRNRSPPLVTQYSIVKKNVPKSVRQIIQESWQDSTRFLIRSETLVKIRDSW